MKIIPAIDIKDGSCVRLFRGEFDRKTEYSQDPVAVAHGFRLMGFTVLHVVDLDGAQSGNQKNRRIVEQIAMQTDFSVQVGGGIRSTAVLETWFGSRVARCVIGSMAVTEPGVAKAWLRRFGADRIVLALDVRVDDEGVPMLATHGWTRSSGVSLWSLVDDYAECGLRHVLCTDISRDGALTGPNKELYGEFVKRYPGIELQASGGVRDINDLAGLRDAGASAAITGRALLDGRISAGEIASFLRAA